MSATRSIGIVALLVGMNACSPTTPTTADLNGRWGGSTCPPSMINSCVIGFTIVQTGSMLSGQWDTTSSTGTFTGTVDGSVVQMVMTSTSPVNVCRSTVAASVDEGEMNGTITATCPTGTTTRSILLRRVSR